MKENYLPNAVFMLYEDLQKQYIWMNILKISFQS